jgi:hypothetical protein
MRLKSSCSEFSTSVTEFLDPSWMGAKRFASSSALETYYTFHLEWPLLQYMVMVRLTT